MHIGRSEAAVLYARDAIRMCQGNRGLQANLALALLLLGGLMTPR